MGAALLPALVAPLIGAAVQTIFAPPAPQPTIIKPADIQPSLTADAAAKIAASTDQKSQAFGQQMLNGILSRAKDQGVGTKELASITDKFNTWYGQNKGQIDQSLALQAAHSQAQADYQNAIQNNNFNAQLQALQASTPQGPGIGGALGSMASGLFGGMPGGQYATGFVAPQQYPNMISGPDITGFSA